MFTSDKDEFLVQAQSPDGVKIKLQEFENKYQNFKNCWNFELLQQKENSLTAQVIDHGYEPAREKGQSDAPVFLIFLESAQENVFIRWKLRWKKSKSRLSWVLLISLLFTGLMLLLFISGDKKVLLTGIWAFCGSLYGGWLVQNLWHDQCTKNIFREMLGTSFPSEQGREKEQV